MKKAIFTRKSIFIFVGIIVLVAFGVTLIMWKADANNTSSAYLLIDKVHVVELESEYSIIVEVLSGKESRENEFALVSGEKIRVVYDYNNERITEFMGKIKVGSIINISRRNTTKLQLEQMPPTLECTGMDIYDDKGEKVVEYY